MYVVSRYKQPALFSSAGMTESGVTVKNQQQHRAMASRKRKVMPQQCLENVAPDNEFERQRFERIERNRQIMAEMGVQQAAAEMKQAMQKPKKKRVTPKPNVRLRYFYYRIPHLHRCYCS